MRRWLLSLVVAVGALIALAASAASTAVVTSGRLSPRVLSSTVSSSTYDIFESNLAAAPAGWLGHAKEASSDRWTADPNGTTRAQNAVLAADTAGDLATSCVNSFTADTPVTLADGRQEPIKDVKVGDKVLATDPQTGVTKAEPVVALIRHSGQHAIVLVTLADGSVLDATSGHKIWDATQHTFVNAGELRAGDQIETDTGGLITVASLTGYSADLTAYNLQISTIHTYYAGTTPVLVHNSCTSIISDDSYLVKAAEKAGSNSSVQRELDSLSSQLSAGNLNPGIGSKTLTGTGLSYARGANGARVFFRTVDGGVQIVAKASKANESGVISRLQATYGG